jgi:hypothetical protein
VVSDMVADSLPVVDENEVLDAYSRAVVAVAEAVAVATEAP